MNARLPVGFILGTLIGLGIGLFANNVPLFLSLGVAFGLVFSFSLKKKA